MTDVIKSVQNRRLREGKRLVRQIMTGVNKRLIGTVYEKAAGSYLMKQGYQILQYNFRCRMGEVDIIAKDGAYLVFVEVKYRTNTASGEPLEAVDLQKQRKISKAAAYYCMTHGYGETTPCRFDVAAILGNDIQLIKNAFEYCGF